MFLANTASQNMMVYQMDMKIAFLNGEQNKVLYFSQLERFVYFDRPTHVFHLKRALYGLKQTPRAWYDTLSKFLLENGFSKGVVEDDENGVVELYFVRTEFLLADFFTKAL